MAKRFISCDDCSHWEEVSAKNAKRCHVCRLVKNLEFMRGRQAKCWLCEDKFCPVARDDQLCGKCCISLKSAEQVECAFCHLTRTSVSKDIAVCVFCARDVQYRKRFLSSIGKKQAERQAQPPGPKPEPPTPVVEPILAI